MMFQKIIGTCCQVDPSKLPVLPPRRFESIPDETMFGKQVRIKTSRIEDQKPFLRNRMILLGIMAFIVVYFQFKEPKKIKS